MTRSVEPQILELPADRTLDLFRELGVASVHHDEHAGEFEAALARLVRQARLSRIVKLTERALMIQVIALCASTLASPASNGSPEIGRPCVSPSVSSASPIRSTWAEDSVSDAMSLAMSLLEEVLIDEVPGLEAERLVEHLERPARKGEEDHACRPAGRRAAGSAGREVGESQVKPALLKLARRKIVERRPGRFGE